MTVNIICSDTSAGDSLADTVDLGSGSEGVSPGEDSTVQDIFIRHDAVVAAITDCAFYVTRYAGTGYLGDDADADYEEIMGWGDDSVGGIQINQVIPGGWTEGDEFESGDWDIFKNSHGDINSQVVLSEDAIVGTSDGAGVLPLNDEAHVQLKVAVPNPLPGGIAAYRAISLVFAYSATS